MAIAAMILGICSLVFCWLGCWGGISIIPFGLSIAGVILGALSMGDSSKKGMAITGLITAIVGLTFTLLMFACVGCAACFACVEGCSNASSMSYYY